MGGKRNVIEEAGDGFSREVNRSDFFGDDTEGFAASERDFDDVAGF